jgi:20S proteasome subunit beta 1
MFGSTSSFTHRELMDPMSVMHMQRQMGAASICDADVDLSKPVDLGTSIMAVEYDGGVVCGADSRTSTGSYIANRVSDKITALDDQIYTMRSGSAADTQAVSDYVKYYLDMHRNSTQQPTAVKTAAKLVSMMLYENKGSLMGEMIVAGWDKLNGGQVYKCAMGGSLIRRPYSTGGSGSIFIAAHCESNFREGMTREQAMAFVDNSLRLAMASDGSSGGSVRKVIIDASGVTRTYTGGVY